jgi:2-oxoglutarate dehydrogenase complex dehydrogenase (E1) component-like enzyme
VNKDTISVEQNFSKSEIAIVIKRQVRFNTSYNVIVICSGKYDFDLAQNMKKKKTTKAKPKEMI